MVFTATLFIKKSRGPGGAKPGPSPERRLWPGLGFLKAKAASSQAKAAAFRPSRAGRTLLRSDHTYIRKALCEGAQSGISIVTGQIEIHSLLHSLRIPSYPARRCCIPKEAVRHYTVLDTSPKKSCASVIPGWSQCVTP